MNSESVDLIATDPPFNKNRDFHATPDSLASGASFQDTWSWERDVHQEWVDQITDDFPKVMNVIQGSRNSYGDDMGAFLCFMAVRLLEMRRVLKPTGSIYLHCDPTASHYLKELLDAIFGRENFRNEIVWCYQTGGVSKRWFGRKHDIIFFYSRSGNYFIDLERVRDKRTPEVLRRLATGNKSATRAREETRLPFDVWTNIQVLNAMAKERLGYPTQKPLALYERIIKASSNVGDRVLDPFCGCATTLIAAEKLKRQWVGCDIWKKAHDLVIRRLQDENLAAPDGDTGGRLFTVGQIHYATEPPQRTDDGLEVVPFLKTKLKVHEPKDRKMSRAEMVQFLIEQHGSRCQGCNRLFDDPRYLELDHNTPRSDGGINHISNRILLCGPCNKLKSNQYTLGGLRRKNKKLGYLKEL